MIVMSSDFDSFIDLVYSTRDYELLKDFLIGVTTEKEREELTHRVEIVRRLLAGEPQLKIARDLNVGVATITRGSKELSKGAFKILRLENDGVEEGVKNGKSGVRSSRKKH